MSALLLRSSLQTLQISLLENRRLGNFDQVEGRERASRRMGRWITLLPTSNHVDIIRLSSGYDGQPTVCWPLSAGASFKAGVTSPHESLSLPMKGAGRFIENYQSSAAMAWERVGWYRA
jgi:hypothetical protein